MFHIVVLAGVFCPRVEHRFDVRPAEPLSRVSAAVRESKVIDDLGFSFGHEDQTAGAAPEYLIVRSSELTPDACRRFALASKGRGLAFEVEDRSMSSQHANSSAKHTGLATLDVDLHEDRSGDGHDTVLDETVDAPQADCDTACLTAVVTSLHPSQPGYRAAEGTHRDDEFAIRVSLARGDLHHNASRDGPQAVAKKLRRVGVRFDREYRRIRLRVFPKKPGVTPNVRPNVDDRR